MQRLNLNCIVSIIIFYKYVQYPLYEVWQFIGITPHFRGHRLKASWGSTLGLFVICLCVCEGFKPQARGSLGGHLDCQRCPWMFGFGDLFIYFQDEYAKWKEQSSLAHPANSRSFIRPDCGWSAQTLAGIHRWPRLPPHPLSV